MRQSHLPRYSCRIPVYRPTEVQQLRCLSQKFYYPRHWSCTWLGRAFLPCRVQSRDEPHRIVRHHPIVSCGDSLRKRISWWFHGTGYVAGRIRFPVYRCARYAISWCSSGTRPVRKWSFVLIPWNIPRGMSGLLGESVAGFPPVFPRRSCSRPWRLFWNEDSGIESCRTCNECLSRLRYRRYSCFSISR